MQYIEIKPCELFKPEHDEIIKHYGQFIISDKIKMSKHTKFIIKILYQRTKIILISSIITDNDASSDIKNRMYPKKRSKLNL